MSLFNELKRRNVIRVATAYVVAANQGASLEHYPPFSWPGGSMVVDYDGRIVAQASPGPGERIVVAPIDIESLRHTRATRTGHQMLAQLRTEMYPVYGAGGYPAGELTDTPNHAVEVNEAITDAALKRIKYRR